MQQVLETKIGVVHSSVVEVGRAKFCSGAWPGNSLLNSPCVHPPTVSLKKSHQRTHGHTGTHRPKKHGLHLSKKIREQEQDGD